MATACGSRSRKGKHQAAGQWIRKERRLAIYLRDDFRCVYCLRDLRDAAPMDATLDHVVCRADGGTHHESNLVTSCRSCNCARQDKPLERFASAEARRHVRRNTARKLGRYLKMAKALIAGRAGDAGVELAK